MSKSERQRLIAMLRENGHTDAEIMKIALQNVYLTERRQLVIDVGADLGLEPTEALRTARGANLIPTSRPPRKTPSDSPEKPLDKTQESTS